MDFSDFKLSPPIQKAVLNEEYVNPTPIQEAAIEPILRGSDLVACAQTGTGKTAAFLLPILEIISGNRTHGGVKRARALIVTPTRELALQIWENAKALGRYTGVRSTVIFGGVSQQKQVEELRGGVDILVATPGRLLDLHAQGYINLGGVEIFVLDEADRMLDMGFIHDVRRIITLIPTERQTLLFSATMPDEIVKLSKTLLKNPESVSVTPSATTVESVSQSVYFVDKLNKRKLLLHILKDKDIRQALVFTRTKHGADRVAKELSKAKVPSAAIHGDKSQGARQGALSKFKDGGIEVLVATDIAARGLDIAQLPFVINYDLPNMPETYVHRIGRTGRAGLAGEAISFCDITEKEYLGDIEKTIRQGIEVCEEHPFPMEVLVPPDPVKRPPRPPRIEHKPGMRPSGRRAGKPPQKPHKTQRHSRP